MKNVMLLLSIVTCVAIIAVACNKNSNNYSVADHTTGMVNGRLWSGNAYGYTQGDTLLTTGDTTHTVWAKIFSRTITDTSFSVQKINGFEVTVLGTTLTYRLTDSTNNLIRFDSVVTGTLNAILKYNYLNGSMSYEYHNVTGYNTNNHQYYQVNLFLHTN